MDDSDQPKEEVEDEDRRRVLGIFSKSLLGLMAAGTLAGPTMMALHPAIESNKDSSQSNWFSLGNISTFEVGGNSQKIVLRRDRRDAWLIEKNVPIGSVLTQRTDETTFRVFSAVCPHLGCAVKPQGEQGFLCPCHNSAFTLDGTRSAGKNGASNPSPRGLDSLEWRIQDDELQVLWTEYEIGTPDKRAKG